MTPCVDKLFAVTPPAAIIDNTSAVANVIDCAGFNFLRVIVLLGASDIAMTALKLQESDVKASATTLTSGADITGAVFGTSVNDTGSTSTLPSATADNLFFVFEIDLRGRKRYILPVITGGDGAAGAFFTCIAELSKANNVPTLATEKNISQVLRLPA